MMENPQVILIPFSKVVIDGIFFLLVTISYYTLLFLGQPVYRGFFCNDETLAYPFFNRNISDLSFFLYGGVTTSLVIAAIEAVTQYKRNLKMSTLGRKIPYWLWRVYLITLTYNLGCTCTIFTTNIVKGTVGRLRPYFLTACVPNINCSLVENQFKYHTNFTCTNSNFLNEVEMTLLRSSFPSGHSSYAMFTMVFFAIYLQVRFTWKGSYFLKPVIQTFCIATALYIGVSRITIYVHHPSDVFAGFVIGAFNAIIFGRYVSDLFTTSNIKTENSDLETISSPEENGRGPL